MVAVVVVVAVRLLLNVSAENAAAASRVSALPQHADPGQLYAAAERAARQGTYAAAIALLFRAALAALDRRGALRDDPARTVNECRRDVRLRAAGLSAAFDFIAQAFTAAVYADDRVTAAQWSAAQRAYQQFSEPQSDAA